MEYSLPKSVVEAQSLNSFKNKLDHYWKGQEIDFDYLGKNWLESETDVLQSISNRMIGLYASMPISSIYGPYHVGIEAS